MKGDDLYNLLALVDLAKGLITMANLESKDFLMVKSSRRQEIAKAI